WENLGPALLCDADTDYIDRHYYWDHPKVDFGWRQEFDNLPMLTDFEDGLLPALTGSKVAGKPLVVTEWCCCWINDTIAEGPLIGAAYACRQDWDAMIWFDISHILPDSQMGNEFDIADKPHLFAQWTAAALLFHRRDLAPFSATARYRISREDLLAGQPLSTPMDPRAGLQWRVEIEIADKSLAASSTPATHAPDGASVTWDEQQGTLTVISPCTAALDGFLGAGKPYDLGWAKVTVGSDFCVLWLTSLDSGPLATSRRILLTAAARAENTGTRYNSARTTLLSSGKAPILIEPVRARLDFPQAVTIRPLDQQGRLLAPQMVKSLALGQGKTFWWVIER
ncbi:MAG TPA: hypothetical protein VGM23_01155, partial [Armatimonadota bacterium]